MIHAGRYQEYIADVPYSAAISWIYRKDTMIYVESYVE